MADKVAAWRTTRQLRVDFMTSPEFREKNPDLALTNERAVVIKEIAPGLRLFVDLSDQVVGMGIVHGSYETEELELVRRHVRAGDTALDIGANVGLFTIHMAALVGPQGKVYAFEPSPELAELLARSVAENGFAGRVELVRAAVADRSGTAGLFSGHDPLNRSGSFLLRGGAVPEVPGDVLDVPVIQLDAQPLRRPVSLVKIDVEGAEPLALRGAERLLREDRPIILAEINPAQLARVAGTTPAAFLAEMGARGYACRTLDGRPASPELAGGGILSVVFTPQ
ncbi:MAG TPA: FkbM family methyltransferase [Thermoanaerobaculia bacterium]